MTSILEKKIGQKINGMKVQKIQILPYPIGTYDCYNDVSPALLQKCLDIKIPLKHFYVLRNANEENFWHPVD